MHIFTKDDLMVRKEEILKKIKEGAVFIYPTDTIYGIGCNAGIKESVQRIRKIKGRHTQPFSVIAPSKEWIEENLSGKEISHVQEWLAKLPGPYTLIMNMRMTGVVCMETNNGLSTLGVRLPDHWFTHLVHEVDVPIITTSANVHGKDFMTSMKNLDPAIKQSVDFIVYEGEKQGRPSKIVNLTVEKTELIER